MPIFDYVNVIYERYHKPRISTTIAVIMYNENHNNLRVFIQIKLLILLFTFEYIANFTAKEVV